MDRAYLDARLLLSVLCGGLAAIEHVLERGGWQAISRDTGGKETVTLQCCILVEIG